MDKATEDRVREIVREEMTRLMPDVLALATKGFERRLPQILPRLQADLKSRTL